MALTLGYSLDDIGIGSVYQMWYPDSRNFVILHVYYIHTLR